MLKLIILKPFKTSFIILFVILNFKEVNEDADYPNLRWILFWWPSFSNGQKNS